MANNTIDRTMLLAEIINVCGWFENFKETKIKELSIKNQWNILSNIKELAPAVAKFQEFRQNLESDLSNEYFGSDEKSEEISIPERDENGQDKYDEDENPIMQTARRVREEYITEYQQKVNNLNSELQKLLLEKATYQLKPIDIDEIVEGLDNNTTIELQDIEMLSFCDRNTQDTENNGDE